MYEIIEYIEVYEQDSKKLIIDVSVKEYGFKEFEQDFLNADYNKYKKSGGNFWLVLNNNNVIGTMALEKKDNIGYLSGVYLHKEYRGMGIADKLLKMVIEYSKKNKIDTIILGTYKKYLRAISFYEKNKFIRFKEENDEYYYKLSL